MEPDQPSPSDYNQPVAYDAEGRPLYSHPPVDDEKTEEQAQPVYITQPADPIKPTISDATKLKHNRSKQLFPEIDLGDNEYVISAVQRHPIGLFIPVVTGVLLVTLSFILLFNYDLISKSLHLTGAATSPSVILLPVIAFMSVVILGTYAAYYIYANNKLFLTNENIVQEIQAGLFSKREQTVNLANIEDMSFSQNGIVQQVFNYGSIRLTTEGNGTTYRFSYVANPKEYIATLNNTIEAYRNGRLIED